jgi:tetratricopeptide (TPR) repeat protein
VRSGLPIDARQDSVWYVLRKAVARNRVRAALIGATFATALAAGVVSTALWRRAERDRARAESQGARAADIGDFLADAFAAVDPDRAQGRAVTLREVLDEASARLSSERGRDPAAELELQRTIGRAYVGLEMYGQATQHLKRAVELARGDADADALELARLLASLSFARRGVAPTAEAEELLVEADELLAREAGRGRDVAADRALVALNRATLARLLGRLVEAEERFAGARALVARTFGDPSEELAAALASFGVLRLQRGEPAGAEELMREALSRLEALGEGETTRASALLGRHGQALEAGGRVAEARERYRDARDLTARLLGAQHAAALLDEVRLLRASTILEGQPVTLPEYEALVAQRAALSGGNDQRSAEALNDLGNEAFARGELALAEELQRTALARYEELLAHDSYEVAVARGNLARTLSRRGELEEAGALLRDSHERLRELLGPRTVSEANALAHLAWIRVQAGEWDAALEASRQALAIRLERYGEDHAAVASSRMDLGWFLFVRAEFSEAEAELLEALAWHRARPAPDGAEMARCLHTLGFVRLEQGRPVEAEALLREALELRRTWLSDEHPDVAETMNALGMALLFQGQGDEVEPLWRGALAILRRQGEDYPRTAWVLGNLGAWSRMQGDLDAAEEYYDECVTLARRTAAPNHPLLAVNLAGRAVLHGLRGESSEAYALLVESFDVLRAERGLENPQTRQVLEALIGTCDELGLEAQAEEYRALLEG